MPSSNMLKIPMVLISSLIMIIVIGGCKTGNFGRLQSDPQATQSFETVEVLPGHTYYFRGTASLPRAIAGIHEDFTLNSNLWTQIDTQSDEFRRLIRLVGLQGTGAAETIRPWGFKILTHDDRYVGLWYSALRTASVEVNENNEIITLAPTGNITRGGQR